MSNSSSSSTTGGISLFGIVFVVFLVLKLAEIGAVATWSWWWVFSPLWGPFVIVVGVFAVFLVIRGIIAIIMAIGEGISSRKRVREFYD